MTIELLSGKAESEIKSLLGMFRGAGAGKGVSARAMGGAGGAGSILSAGDLSLYKKIMEEQRNKDIAGKLALWKKTGSMEAKGGMLGGMGGITKMLGPLAGIGLIVGSSKALQGTLNKIMNLVMQIIRPIGDIISIGLQPIISILRPIGVFFNTLMRPYLKKAMDAMRTGDKLARTGDVAGAGASYALGIGFLLKPVFDEMVTIATLTIEGVLFGIKALGSLLINVFSPLLNLFGLMPNNAENIKKLWEDTMNGLITWTGEMGKSVIRITDEAMTAQLDILKGRATEATAEWNNIAGAGKTGMGNLKGEVETGFIGIIDALTKIMTNKQNEITTSARTYYPGGYDDPVTQMCVQTSHAVNPNTGAHWP